MEKEEFKPNLSKNVLFERLEFNRRCRESEETFHNFLESIRKLADTCEFHVDEKEFLIRDRFICGLNDENLQSKIVIAGGNPNVNEVFEICRGHQEESISCKRAEEPLIEIKEEPLSSEIADGYEVYLPECSLVEEPVDYHSYESSKPVNAPKSDRSRKRTKGPVQKHEFDYKCPVCNKDFIDFIYFKGHLVEHVIEKDVNYKGKTELKCYFCQREFKKYDRLISHFCSHSRKNIILPKVKCTVCGRETAVRYARQHRLQHIAENQILCNECGKLFSTVIQLNRHKKIHKEFEKLACDVCNKVFHRAMYLETHKKSAHPDFDPKIEAIECFMCKRRVHSILALKRHFHWHSNTTHLCMQCGAQFRNSNCLKRHLMRDDHNGAHAKKFVCSVCGLRCYDATQLSRHSLVHTDERPYVCHYENCTKRYRSKKVLTDHFRTHTGEKPFHCQFCEYRGSSRTYLKAHMLVHTGRVKKNKDESGGHGV